MSPTDQLKIEAIAEGIKEFGRVVLIAVVSAAITAATSYVAGIHDPIVQAVLLSVLTGLGKAWDKKVHADLTTDRQGVLPF